MRLRLVLLTLLVASGAASSASAQAIEQTQFWWRRPAPGCDLPATGPITILPSDPKVDPKDRKDPAAAPIDPEAFRQAPSAGSSAGQTFNPGMFGDLGASGSTTVVIRGGSRSTPTATLVRVPVVGRGAYKVSDAESPRPTDRVFFNYNYYHRVVAPDGSSTPFNLSRETIGFETTFLDGDASFGMRLPFLQTSGAGNIAGFLNNDIGDLSLIFKYAFVNDRFTGDVLSTGLVLTAPTAANGIPLSDGSEMRDFLIQPFVGWIVNDGPLFAQGFHSIAAPTDRRDLTSLNNDIAIGWSYFTYGRFVQAVVPMLECHIFTPLDHRSATDDIQAHDIVTLTGGLNFVLPGGSVLGAAVAVPVTGPRPNSVESIVTLNIRF